MKEVIRRGLFETNSSSVHSITMCSDDMYTRWLNGDGVYYDRDEEELVESTPEIEEQRKEEEGNGYYCTYLTNDEFYDWDYLDFEKFHRTYTTQSGETIHSFGFYGHD